MAFPAGLKQAFSGWKVGRTAIDDRPVQIVQGTNAGLLPVNLYFDTKSGLLVRIVRWNATPVGPVPTEINYDDYRDVAGVKMPFTWTVSQTYMQMTIKLTAIQPNVPVDAAVFSKAKTGTLLQPVDTKQYGWFVIKLLGDAKPTPESQVAETIRAQLEQQDRNQEMTNWVSKVTKNYCNGGKIKYQAGYQPSPDPCATLTGATSTSH